MAGAEDWSPELAEIAEREAMAAEMGGPERVKRQKDGGKLTVRERIAGLLDPGSFHEIGGLSGHAEYDEQNRLTKLTPSSFVLGRGRIDGRPVVVGGNDFTVRASGPDPAAGKKSIAAERLALELKVPLIRLIDGFGGSVRTQDALGRTYIPDNPGWEHMVANLGQVPVVALGLGTIAGIHAARLIASHYSVMVRGKSHMFMAGPPVMARLGQTFTKEELGGADLQAKAGACDAVAETEEEAFALARRFLSYLPASVHELPEQTAPSDQPDRRDDWLLSAIPRNRRKAYDARRIVRALVDRDSFFEIGAAFGGSMITGLARFDGWPVALMASNPMVYGGGWTAEASQKVSRFVDFANVFHLPVITLVDIPGFVIGLEAEMAGTVRHGGRALTAIYQSQVPWCSVILRKSFGVAGAGHTDHSRVQYRFAWPSADWGSMPVEGGVEAAYRAEIEAAPDREAKRQEIEDRLNAVRSPLRSAEHFLIEEMIDPRDTRRLLCEFANLTAKLRRPGPVSFGVRP
ncbi:acyl-CoA carboxylase subunit beta [Phenylobacterium sp.]|jgi:acetyl-CoA carboxylase carboxyltransferase component|uniref:acyl-CoA carboxylase subunit beta n=1 Tax=Phenylobacterium sp. TaxID=1871053 RepID=UPI002F9287EE